MFRSPKTLLLSALILAGAAGLLAQVVCQIGNLEDPVGLPVPDIVEGQQTFAYLVHPVEQCNCTEGFFKLQDTFMWLDFEPPLIPQNFIVRAGIRSAIWNAAWDRWEPDGPLYESVEFNFEAMDPGPFLLQVPAIDAPSLDVNEIYFLTLDFETPLEANLLCDGMDQPGMAYSRIDGSIWIDLYGPDKTSGGKPIIWGDVLCGPNDGSPVPLPQAAPRLEQPFPNPFNPGTRISLGMDKPGHVKLTIHDSRGHLVKVLADEQLDQGTWRYEWDGTNARGQLSPAGLYFFRAETADGVTVRKAALVK